MPKILIVDDEIDIAKSIQYVVQQEGFVAIIAQDGIQALNLYQDAKPDLILLDVMMPGLDGFEVCRKIRATDTKTPILMLTAKSSEIDTVVGLELGANDYIAKPVRLREIVARIKSQLRDNKQDVKTNSKIEFKELIIDIDSRQVFVDGEIKELSYKEFELLLVLAKNPNCVFTRDKLFSQVWGSDFLGESRTVDVHVRYLREKLEACSAKPKLLQTVRGVGYKLNVSVKQD